MQSTQKRLRAIELSLTPQQVVVVWVRNALQAGTCEDAVRRTPLPRGAVANAVYSTVRNSMKGQDDSLIERAVLQARQEADSSRLQGREADASASQRTPEDRQDRLPGTRCPVPTRKSSVPNLVESARGRRYR
jgi:hypothetical protein